MSVATLRQVQVGEYQQDWGGPGQVPYSVTHPDPSNWDRNPEILRTIALAVPLSNPDVQTAALEQKSAKILGEYPNIRYLGLGNKKSMQKLVGELKEIDFAAVAK